MRAWRALGQNFLVSPKVMDRIVEAAQVGPEDVIVEIGTGLGRLTAHLAAGACAVVSVEIDRRLYEIARARLAESADVTLLCCDFLASKHKIHPTVTQAVLSCSQGHRVKVVSNLPYKISSPAVIDLLEWEVTLSEIDVMVQAEVADRLTARPGQAQYGPLTVFAGYHAEVEKLFSLPPSAFWPRPAVSSTFLRITPRLHQPAARDYLVFCEVVNKLLQNRRKALSHALQIGWGRTRARQVLELVQAEGGLRPEALGVAEFVRIADALASCA